MAVWQKHKWLTRVRSIDAEVPVIEREDSVDTFALREMHQDNIRKVKPLVVVDIKNLIDACDVGNSERENLESLAIAPRKQFTNRLLGMTQKVRCLGDDGPTGEKWQAQLSSHCVAGVMELLVSPQ